MNTNPEDFNGQPKLTHPETDISKELQPVDQETLGKIRDIVLQQTEGGVKSSGLIIGSSLGFERIEDGLILCHSYENGLYDSGGNKKIACVTTTTWLDKPYGSQIKVNYYITEIPDGLGVSKRTNVYDAPKFEKKAFPHTNVPEGFDPVKAIRDLREKLISESGGLEEEKELGLDFVSQAEGEEVLRQLTTAGPRPDRN
jgi:hypothetical protein